MRSIKESNALAKSICSGGYRYLYGAKDQAYTSELVEKLAKLYPSVYTASLTKLALQDADKGYKGIDCSGFVCKVLGVSSMGSSAIHSTAYKTYPVEKKYAKPGMALWHEGHIAYVGEDCKIYEAASTASDMKVSKWENRASSFKALCVVKGSMLEAQMKEEAVRTYKLQDAEEAKAETTTKTSSSKVIFSKGCQVKVSGYIYANADGSGAKVEKKNATMYIVGGVANQKYPYAVAAKKGGTRQGWASASDMKKC